MSGSRAVFDSRPQPRSESRLKYPDITLGRVEAVWNKLGGEDGVEKLLQGKLGFRDPTLEWFERDGVVYFNVVSEGWSGQEVRSRILDQGASIEKRAEQLLLSEEFVPTTGRTQRIGIMKGGLLQRDGYREVVNVARACGLGSTTLSIEATYLAFLFFLSAGVKKSGLNRLFPFHANTNAHTFLSLHAEDNRDPASNYRLVGLDGLELGNVLNSEGHIFSAPPGN